MSSSFVWVRLYYKGNDEPEGQAIFIKIESLDLPVIGALAEAAKDKLKPKIDYAPVDEIFIYPPETKPPFSQVNSIRPGKKLEELIQELKKKNPPTSDDHPLIVVAPAPPPQPRADGKKRSRFGLFVHLFVFLLLNLFKLSTANFTIFITI